MLNLNLFWALTQLIQAFMVCFSIIVILTVTFSEIEKKGENKFSKKILTKKIVKIIMFTTVFV